MTNTIDQSGADQPLDGTASGGLGSLLDDENKYARRKSVGLAARAVRERWDIPKGIEKALPSAMADIALNSPDEKNRIAAGGVVVKMMGQNQSDEHLLHKTDTDGSEKHKVEVVYVNKPKQSHEDRPVATAGLLPVAVGGTAPVPERGSGGELPGSAGGD